MTSSNQFAHSLFPWSKERTDVPIILRGTGIYFFATEDENRPIADITSGAISLPLGYRHLAIERAFKSYESMLPTVPLFAKTIEQLRLEELLHTILPDDFSRFAFFTSGSNAVDAAIRAAQNYMGRSKIISLSKSFHGSPSLNLAYSGDSRRRFVPEGITATDLHIKAPVDFFGTAEEQMEASLADLAYVLDANKNKGEAAALIMEPILGTAGAYAYPRGYIREVRRLLDKHDVLLIFDEVMTFARTGALFAFEHEGVVPDILILGKGITGGFTPLSAVAFSQEIGETYKDNPFPAGETFSGYSFGCHMARAVISTIVTEGLAEQGGHLGRIVQEEMNSLVEKQDSVRCARTHGLLGAIDLQRDSDGTPYRNEKIGPPVAMRELKRNLYKRGVYASLRESAIMVCPPLIITEEEIRSIFSVINMSIDESLDPWFLQ